MKRTKLRKRSKSKVTIDKADRALQNWFRSRYPKAKCEVCGRRAEVRHHHLRKSQSNAGRYMDINLIALCHKCHTKISFGDMSLVAIYSLKRGKIWIEAIEALKRIKRPPYGKKLLEQIMGIYKICPKNEQQNQSSPF